MNKLLSAGFFQLRKNKVFLILTLFMFGLGLVVVATRYYSLIKYNQNEFFDATLFVFTAFIGCCAAVFCSMFTGTEYSDGTIRNKLIVGHTRVNIFLSNLIVSVTATVLMAAAYLLSYCPLGAILLKAPQFGISAILYCFAVSLFMMIAYASLFNMLSMLITKKSVSAVVCLLLFFVLLMVGIMIKERLDAPEFISSYSMSLNGVELSEPEPNPKYLQATARTIYQFFYDFIPSGQSIQLAGTEVAHPARMMLYSLCITAITSIGGILSFRKKDLK